MNSSTLAILHLLLALHGSGAFVLCPRSCFAVKSPSTTRIYLEDHIADMIDKELHRQSHKKEFERDWMEKNRGAILSQFEKDQSDFLNNDSDEVNFRQRAKDRIMAAKDPEAYCRDRCVSTGSCEVFEDFFNYSPEEVVTFCTECVMSEEDGACEIPEVFFDNMDKFTP